MEGSAIPSFFNVNVCPGSPSGTDIASATTACWRAAALALLPPSCVASILLPQHQAFWSSLDESYERRRPCCQAVERAQSTREAEQTRPERNGELSHISKP